MNYGKLTGPAVGIILKEAVRRANKAILLERAVFEATAKQTEYKTGQDWVTTADRRAQAIYVEILQDCFPGFGIVGEEDDLIIPCTLPKVNAYFTLDPLDGTSAFVRRQSWGIGTMIALVVDNQVVSAYIGEVMSEEIYGYRPGSTKVHRISQYDQAELLKVDTKRLLADQYALLLQKPWKHSKLVRQMVGESEQPLVRGLEVNGGSIGTAMARLWKGEVAVAILPPYPLTPWDFAPILGISQQLGFKFLQFDPSVGSGHFELIHPQPAPTIQKQPNELLVVHSSRLPELKQWQKAYSQS